MANGVSTTYTYDKMGRVFVKMLPNGGTVTTDYHNDPVPPLITTTTAAAPDPDIMQDQQFDGLRRVVHTTLYAPECNVTTDTSYDALGRVSSVSNPHCPTASSTDGSTSTVYDALSRPQKVTKQDASTVGYVYAGNKSTVTDETGRQHSSYADALGRLIQVDEEATHLIPASPGSPATSGTEISQSPELSRASRCKRCQRRPGRRPFHLRVRRNKRKHPTAPCTRAALFTIPARSI